MYVSDEHANGLVSERDLRRFHRARALVYDALHQLLEVSLEPHQVATLAANLKTATENLGIAPGFRPLFDELDRVAAPLVPLQESDLVRCGDATAIAPVFREVGVVPRGVVLDEVQLLAELARRTDQALTRGDLIAAARSVELQTELLTSHIRRCAHAFGDQMAASGQPLPRAVGEILPRLIAHDAVFLGGEEPGV